MATQSSISQSGAVEDFPSVRRITLGDLRDVLKEGLADFEAMPSHVFLLGVLYPVVGLILGRLAFGYDVLYLVFPLIAGFTLLGPAVAIVFYELSRRREAGEDLAWSKVLSVLNSPSIGGIVCLTLLLVGVFLAWLWVANFLYTSIFGAAVPTSISDFVSQVLTTPAGWRLIAVGNAIGFLFAALIFVISVVSFPLLLDRSASAGVAIATSFKAVRTNPFVMVIWGLIVAVSLALGSIPFLFGLAVVVPILGHATWHLYRKVVAH